MEKKGRIIYLVLVLGIWTGFLGITLRETTWQALLLERRAIFSIFVGYAALFSIGWLINANEEERG